MRERGYYWVNFRGDWIPASFDHRDPGAWNIIGSDYTFYDGEFYEIGPRIHPPATMPRMAFAALDVPVAPI